MWARRPPAVAGSDLGVVGGVAAGLDEVHRHLLGIVLPPRLAGQVEGLLAPVKAAASFGESPDGVSQRADRAAVGLPTAGLSRHPWHGGQARQAQQAGAFTKWSARSRRSG